MQCVYFLSDRVLLFGFHLFRIICSDATYKLRISRQSTMIQLVVLDLCDPRSQKLISCANSCIGFPSTGWRLPLVALMHVPKPRLGQTLTLDSSCLDGRGTACVYIYAGDLCTQTLAQAGWDPGHYCPLPLPQKQTKKKSTICLSVRKTTTIALKWIVMHITCFKHACKLYLCCFHCHPKYVLNCVNP